MYILSHDNKPFATVNDKYPHLIENAIAGEFSYEEVEICKYQMKDKILKN